MTKEEEYDLKKIKKRARRLIRKERRIERRKKHREIPKEIKNIDIELIYFAHKPWHDPYIKYWRPNNGSLLRFVNCPWTLFVEDYIRLGDKILDDLNNHVFIKWE